MLAADPEEIRIMYQEIENYNWPEIDYACSADTFIELLPKGINKGEAVCEICDRLGIKREEVVAFGVPLNWIFHCSLTRPRVSVLQWKMQFRN